MTFLYHSTSDPVNIYICNFNSIHLNLPNKLHTSVEVPTLVGTLRQDEDLASFETVEIMASTFIRANQ